MCAPFRERRVYGQSRTEINARIIGPVGDRAALRRGALRGRARRRHADGRCAQAHGLQPDAQEAHRRAGEQCAHAALGRPPNDLVLDKQS